MFRGLYTATSAMQTNQKKIDVIGNNIANANTNGFKKDLVLTEAFSEKLVHKINGTTNYKPLNDNLDIKRDGQGYYIQAKNGFFTVESHRGKSYSRQIRFAVDNEGYLKTYTRDINREIDTTTGNYVLDKNGNRIQVNGEFEIDQNGNIITGANVVGNILYNPPKTVIGTVNAGLRIDRIQTNFIQGQMMETKNTLDFAINGDGFFKVQTPNGERYTRNGAFFINERSQLVTMDGYLVLGKNGPIILNKDFDINELGQIYVNGEYLDTLDIVNILNVNGLRKEGHSLYKMEEGIDPVIEEFNGQIFQGFLETSNVDIVNEMIHMINVLREYESNQKIIRSYDEILGKAVNEIGKL
ncbi:flagellar basal-body rod protein FlgG [Alkalithermobacter thermoalcaliphilus JW-YL-7 = DSM 7308]|uniref:Flagellar basal-body rod protein FlgG n=1 Tax=Alkalithermobacter thermoalcaliphilus JW-YL-7 = DSM 7308 TaxID=1121328 RepID=A0A150FPE6_CLOPD|nr:flagellar hook-basal body protein [[Clostridium] paradoxum JW-YL-7 = DSM 7308]SHL05173.1 flagellar basal-body rod protein FlgG [[Clostridium] paradoxum JW-YL-7 = DSM 7308]